MNDGGAGTGQAGGGESAPDGDDSESDARGVSPPVASSVLWGVVGGLSFLVLIQGYELLADVPVSVVAKVGVALAVSIVAAVLSHVGRDRLPVS